MSSRRIEFQDDNVYNKAKEAAVRQGINVMKPKDGKPSWVEEACEEKLKREGK